MAMSRCRSGGDHQYVTDRSWERNRCAHCGQPEPPLSELLGLHDYALLSDFITGGWRLDCSCGHEGPTRKTVSAAVRDVDKHREETKR